jgi:hypothetical protein
MGYANKLEKKALGGAVVDEGLPTEAAAPLNAAAVVVGDGTNVRRQIRRW